MALVGWERLCARSYRSSVVHQVLFEIDSFSPSFLSFLNRTDLRKISKPVSLELREVTIATSWCVVVQQIILCPQEL